MNSIWSVLRTLSVNFARPFNAPRWAAPRAVLLFVGVTFCLLGGAVAPTYAQQPSPSPTPTNQIQLPTEPQLQQTFDRLFDQVVGRPPDASRYVYARELSALNAALYTTMRKFILTYETPLRDKIYLICYILVPIFFIIALLKLAHEPNAGAGSYLLLCFRTVLFIALASYGAQIINLCGRSGLMIATPFRQAADQAQTQFNAAFKKLVENSMIVNWSSGQESQFGIPAGLYAIIFSPQEALANPGENIQHIETFASDVRNWFYLLVHSQALLYACTVFIMYLGFTIVMMMRMFSPFAILVGIDRSLALRITYNYLWGVIAWTLFTPTIIELFRLIAYGACRYAVEAALPIPVNANAVNFHLQGGEIDTIALGFACFVMITFGLAQFGAPYVAYRLSQGQLVEGVITNLSTWAMTAIGTGIEMIGVRFGATLNRRASEMQYYATQRTESGMALNRNAQEVAQAWRGFIVGTKQAEVARTAGFLQNLGTYRNQVMQAAGALRQSLIINQANYNTAYNSALNQSFAQALSALQNRQLGINEKMETEPLVTQREDYFRFNELERHAITARTIGGTAGGIAGGFVSLGAGAAIGAGVGSGIFGEGVDIINRWRLANNGLQGQIVQYSNVPWIEYYNRQATLQTAISQDTLKGFHAKSPSINLTEYGREALAQFGGSVKGTEQILKENLIGMNRAAYAAYNAAVAGAAQQKRLLDSAVQTQYTGSMEALNKDRELAVQIAAIGPYGTDSVRLTDFSGRVINIPKAPGQLELIEQQFRANMEAARLHYTAEVFQGITRDMSRRLEDAIKAVTRY